MTTTFVAGSRVCRVTVEGDHHVIQTTPKRAQAILMVLAGGTLEEVGQHFGLTRERIRQYVVEAGLHTRDRQIIKAQPKQRAAWDRGPAYRAKLYARRQSRIARAVALLRLFAKEHGRAPTYGELYWLMFGRDGGTAATPTLCNHFGRSSQHTTRTRRLHALYRLAGLKVHGLGRPGWADPTTRTHCRRGHPLDDAYISHRPDGGVIRQCRPCQRLRQRAYDARQGAA